jgi:hypothetical protein
MLVFSGERSWLALVLLAAALGFAKSTEFLPFGADVALCQSLFMLLSSVPPSGCGVRGRHCGSGSVLRTISIA